jgi:hypothetical protein
MKTLLFIIALIVAFLLFVTMYCSCGSKDKFDYDIMPDACVHMMETGFNSAAVNACAEYASRCGDTCEPYPMTTVEVNKLYAQFGIIPGTPPSAEIQAKITALLKSDVCITDAGPGGPCVDGEEDCVYPYICSNVDSNGKGVCKCPPKPCEAAGDC